MLNPTKISSELKSEDTHSRKQIHDEGEAKFLIYGKKREVLVHNLDEVETLSEYLNFNMLEYFRDYNPMESYTSNFEMIIACANKSSITESHNGDLSIIFQAMGTNATSQEIWTQSKLKTITLKAFMDPENHQEYFI